MCVCVWTQSSSLTSPSPPSRIANSNGCILPPPPLPLHRKIRKANWIVLINVSLILHWHICFHLSILLPFSFKALSQSFQFQCCSNVAYGLWCRDGYLSAGGIEKWYVPFCYDGGNGITNLSFSLLANSICSDYSSHYIEEQTKASLHSMYTLLYSVWPYSNQGFVKTNG